MKWTNSYRSFGLKTKRSTGLKTIEHKQFGTRSPSSPLYEPYFLQGFAARIRHLSPMRRMTPGTVLAGTLCPNSWTRHMWICRCPHPLAVLPQTAAISGSRSARVTCSG